MKNRKSVFLAMKELKRKSKEKPKQLNFQTIKKLMASLASWKTLKKIIFF